MNSQDYNTPKEIVSLCLKSIYGCQLYSSKLLIGVNDVDRDYFSLPVLNQSLLYEYSATHEDGLKIDYVLYCTLIS